MEQYKPVNILAKETAAASVKKKQAREEWNQADKGYLENVKIPQDTQTPFPCLPLQIQEKRRTLEWLSKNSNMLSGCQTKIIDTE